MKKLIGFTIGIGAGVCLLGFALVVEAVKIIQRAEEQLEADEMYDALWGDEDYDDYMDGVSGLSDVSRGPVPVEDNQIVPYCVPCQGPCVYESWGPRS